MSRFYVVVLPKKRYLFVFFFLLLLLLLSVRVFDPLGAYTLSLVPEEVLYDVMLDAGHGGIDPGAIGQGEIYEKDYVLDIVLQMADILKTQGLRVGLTRESDRDVSHLVTEGTRHRRDLLGRFKLMHEAKVGISVHANATKDPSKSGAIVFYQKGDYLGKIYGKIVLEELERVQVLNEEEPLARTTLLLIKAKPPVLLVEVGFMSNPVDLAKLGDKQFRQSLAHALSNGIIKFLEWQEGEQSQS